MKLRGLLVFSHLASIVAVVLVIGVLALAILLRGTADVERRSMENALASVDHLFDQRFDELVYARNEITSRLAFRAPLGSDLASLGLLHDLLELYRVERIEVFRGLLREAEAYRWGRGSHPDLRTEWFPPNPSVAAQVTGGRPVAWVQLARSGPASLKLCAAIPSGGPQPARWVVVTEPIDRPLLSRLLPRGGVGAIFAGRDLLAAWPRHPQEGGGQSRDLESLLPPVPFAGLIPPLSVRHPLLQLDDGGSLDILLLAPRQASAEMLLVGLRTGFLVLVGGVLMAVALGSGVAAQLLAPLQSLLEGTAAMARGHLMVRLPTTRSDELGALTKEFNRMADEIRNTYVGVISTLAEVVEAKSHYTRQHIDRVERLTRLTAEVLERRGWVRFSSHQRFILSVAAILHDVGKIAIANEILNKSGPLSVAERSQMLTHPEVGAVIVERMGKLERAAEIIRCAHEHFDGSGYPRGLKGEEIPIESRIILVVDAYDAMTMERPYSVVRPQEEAIAELRQEAGRQFDPVVVEAFIEAITGLEKETSGGPVAVDSGLYRILHAGGPGTFTAPRPPASPE